MNEPAQIRVKFPLKFLVAVTVALTASTALLSWVQQFIL